MGAERSIELSRQGLAARSGGEQKWHGCHYGWYRTCIYFGMTDPSRNVIVDSSIIIVLLWFCLTGDVCMILLGSLKRESVEACTMSP